MHMANHYSYIVIEPNAGSEATGSEESSTDESFRRAVEEQAAQVLRWQAAEGRLYPLVMVDPELFEAAVGLVTEARDVLRAECRTAEELTAISSRTVLDRCRSAADVQQQGFDTRLAVDAARAQRWRELSASASS